MSVYAYQALGSLGLSERKLLDLLPSVDVITLGVGDAPVGGFPGSFWHVMDGLVCATNPSGHAAALDFYGPGSWFGEAELMPLPVFGGGGFECLTPVRLMRLPAGPTRAAFLHDLHFSHFIACMAMWRCHLRAAMLGLVKVGKPAPRVVLSLALLAEALHSSSSHLPSASSGAALQIPIKQAVLASHTGMSRAVLSVQLQALVAAGWLRLDYSALSLLQPSAWRDLLKTHLKTSLHARTMPELLATLGALTCEPA